MGNSVIRVHTNQTEWVMKLPAAESATEEFG